jgi:hypothetical protein
LGGSLNDWRSYSSDFLKMATERFQEDVSKGNHLIKRSYEALSLPVLHIKGINHGFKQEEKKTPLFISQG